MPVIKASTPEECKESIINFLKGQAHSYRLAMNKAERKKVKHEAQVKADVCMGIALFLDGCRIEKSQ